MELYGVQRDHVGWGVHFGITVMQGPGITAEKRRSSFHPAVCVSPPPRISGVENCQHCDGYCRSHHHHDRLLPKTSLPRACLQQTRHNLVRASQDGIQVCSTMLADEADSTGMCNAVDIALHLCNFVNPSQQVKGRQQSPVASGRHRSKQSSCWHDMQGVHLQVKSACMWLVVHTTLMTSLILM